MVAGAAHGGGSGPAGAPPRLPRLLCLHGFQTSARILEAQLARAGWGRLAECHALDAPFVSRGPPPPEVLRAFPGLGPHREWWNAEKLPGGDGYDYRGVDASVAAVDDALRAAADRGEPFDGLLGFSQGAGLAHVVMCLAGEREAAAEESARGGGTPSPRFSVLIGGFSSRHGGHRALLERCRGEAAWRGYPSIHIWGARDPAKMGAQRLVRTFPEGLALSMEHPGGHIVPALGVADLERVQRFLLRHQLPKGSPSPTSSL